MTFGSQELTTCHNPCESIHLCMDKRSYNADSYKRGRGGSCKGWVGRGRPRGWGCTPTTEFPQCPLGVVVSVTAFGHMAGLQLYGGLNIPERFITGLQADTREQSQAPGTWCIFNPFVPACMGERERAVERQKRKAAPPVYPFCSCHSTDSLSLLQKWLSRVDSYKPEPNYPSPDS